MYWPKIDLPRGMQPRATQSPHNLLRKISTCNVSTMYQTILVDRGLANLPEPRDRCHEPLLLHYGPISPTRVRVRSLHGGQRSVLGRSFIGQSCRDLALAAFHKGRGVQEKRQVPEDQVWDLGVVVTSCTRASKQGIASGATPDFILRQAFGRFGRIRSYLALPASFNSPSSPQYHG